MACFYIFYFTYDMARKIYFSIFNWLNIQGYPYEDD